MQVINNDKLPSQLVKDLTIINSDLFTMCG